MVAPPLPCWRDGGCLPPPLFRAHGDDRSSPPLFRACRLDPWAWIAPAFVAARASSSSSSSSSSAAASDASPPSSAPAVVVRPVAGGVRLGGDRGHPSSLLSSIFPIVRFMLKKTQDKTQKDSSSNSSLLNSFTYLYISPRPMLPVTVRRLKTEMKQTMSGSRLLGHTRHPARAPLTRYDTAPLKGNFQRRPVKTTTYTFHRSRQSLLTPRIFPPPNCVVASGRATYSVYAPAPPPTVVPP